MFVSHWMPANSAGRTKETKQYIAQIPTWREAAIISNYKLGIEHIGICRQQLRLGTCASTSNQAEQAEICQHVQPAVFERKSSKNSVKR